MVLTATSLVGIPFLGIATQAREALGSSATHGQGAQNLLCAYLAAAVFLGLAGTALFGWWWLDPIAALVVAAVAGQGGASDVARRGLSGPPGEAEHDVER